MQSPFPNKHGADAAAADDTRRVAVAGTIRVAIRSCRGNGGHVYSVDAPANVSIADLKLILCRPPHSVCSDAAKIVLVSKGRPLNLNPNSSPPLWPAPPLVDTRCLQAASSPTAPRLAMRRIR
jgi:hypothetical protein